MEDAFSMFMQTQAEVSKQRAENDKMRAEAKLLQARAELLRAQTQAKPHSLITRKINARKLAHNVPKQPLNNNAARTHQHVELFLLLCEGCSLETSLNHSTQRIC